MDVSNFLSIKNFFTSFSNFDSLQMDNHRQFGVDCRVNEDRLKFDFHAGKQLIILHSLAKFPGVSLVTEHRVSIPHIMFLKQHL